MRRSIFVFLLAVLVCVPCARAQPATLAPVTLELTERRAVDDAPEGSQGTSDEGSIVTVENDRELVAKGVGTTRVRFKNGGNEVATVEVTVEKIVPVVELDGKPVSIADELVVFSGEKPLLKVQMRKRDGSIADIPGTTTVESANPNLIVVTDKQLDVKTLTHTGMIDPPAPAVRVDLKFPGNQTTPLNFVVAEPPASVAVDLPERIREETTTPIQVKVTGSGGGIYQSTTTQFPKLYTYSCTSGKTDGKDNPLATVSTDRHALSLGRMSTNSVPTVRVTCTVFGIGRNTGATGFKDVTALQSGGKILLNPPTLSLFSGQNSKVNAALVDRDNKPIDKARVEWSVAGGLEGVELAPQGDVAVIVTASKDKTKIPESGVINVNAKALVDGGTEITATIPVMIVNASGFTRVRGGLEMLDYETAKDLYGSKTAEDFYVAKITLMNDLTGDLAGASILVFSSSLGIGVNLQKAEFPGSKIRERQVEKLTREKKWQQLTYRDLRKLGLPINYPLLMDSVPHATQPGFPPSDIDSEIVYTCDDIWYAEQPVQLTPQEAESADVEKILQRKTRERDERVAAARLRQLRYRPYPYDMVLKSYDPRDNRTGRSLTFRALTFAGSVASFITGVPNFGASKQFIAVNEKVSSVLVPALAAVWPSMRETQRQNLIDDTMHPIEEIPYGSSLTKMIFLPKYPFQGLQADYWFRISEICPFDFQVEVAISHKEKQMVPVSPIVQ